MIVSILRIESLITIPLITTIPIMDIKLREIPDSHRISIVKATSSGISTRRIIGRVNDSNCAARIKYSMRMATITTTTISQRVS